MKDLVPDADKGVEISSQSWGPTATIEHEDYFRRRHKSNVYQLLILGARSLSQSEQSCPIGDAVLMAVLPDSDPRADRSQSSQPGSESPPWRSTSQPVQGSEGCHPAPLFMRQEENPREEIILDKSPQRGLNTEDYRVGDFPSWLSRNNSDWHP